MQRRPVVLRALDAIRAVGDELEVVGRAFSERAVAILVPPRIGWDLGHDLYPVVGERRSRRAIDEGLEALLGGGVVAGVDFVGAEGGADAMEVGPII